MLPKLKVSKLWNYMLFQSYSKVFPAIPNYGKSSITSLFIMTLSIQEDIISTLSIKSIFYYDAFVKVLVEKTDEITISCQQKCSYRRNGLNLLHLLKN